MRINQAMRKKRSASGMALARGQPYEVWGARMTRLANCVESGAVESIRTDNPFALTWSGAAAIDTDVKRFFATRARGEFGRAIVLDGPPLPRIAYIAGSPCAAWWNFPAPHQRY